MGFREITGSWRKIFTNWKYVSLALVIALFFYEFNVIFASWTTISSFYSSTGLFSTLNLIYALSLGFVRTIYFHSFVSLVVISILIGMLASLIFFKVSAGQEKLGSKAGVIGGVGVFFAALAPGCAACGIGLASVLGIGAGFLSFLPYEGLELSILSIGLLGFTILKVSDSLSECDVCKVKFENNSNNKKMKGGLKNE